MPYGFRHRDVDERLLHFLRAYQRKYGRSPSLAIIGVAMVNYFAPGQVKKTASVRYYLERLKDQGRISENPMDRRNRFILND